MHELTERELYQALEYAKSLDEDSGKRLMSQFEMDQPLLFQTLFGVFPGIIAEQNQDMAHLFMDLCFELICVYQKAFGETPKFADDPTWMERQAVLVDAEFLSLMQKPPGEQSRIKLQAHFLKHHKNMPQLGLLKFMNESIDEFASYSTQRVAAIEFTQTMMLVVVKLFNSLFDKPVIH
ncbi:MAG: hypothetical protein NTV43_07625 [Methylococcales bacterium]|nr:hypothetical protein [Methylococcales bacterium]